MTNPNMQLFNKCREALPKTPFNLPSTVLLLSLEGQPTPTTSTRENPYWHTADGATRRRGDLVPLSAVEAARIAEILNEAARQTGIPAPDLLALTRWKAMSKVLGSQHAGTSAFALVRTAMQLNRGRLETARLKELYKRLSGTRNTMRVVA